MAYSDVLVSSSFDPLCFDDIDYISCSYEFNLLIILLFMLFYVNSQSLILPLLKPKSQILILESLDINKLAGLISLCKYNLE